MENCTKFSQLTVSKIIEIVATSCEILRIKCAKFDLGWDNNSLLLGKWSAVESDEV